MASTDSTHYGVKPDDKRAGGKARGKMRLDVCVWDDDAPAWRLKRLPAQAAAKQIAEGHAVYPVDGVCPIDPPVFEGDGDPVK